MRRAPCRHGDVLRPAPVRNRNHEGGHSMKRWRLAPSPLDGARVSAGALLRDCGGSNCVEGRKLRWRLCNPHEELCRRRREASTRPFTSAGKRYIPVIVSHFHCQRADNPGLSARMVEGKRKAVSVIAMLTPTRHRATSILPEFVRAPYPGAGHLVAPGQADAILPKSQTMDSSADPPYAVCTGWSDLLRARRAQCQTPHGPSRHSHRFGRIPLAPPPTRFGPLRMSWVTMPGTGMTGLEAAIHRRPAPRPNWFGP